MPIRLTPDPTGIRLSLKVVPGASRDRIVGALGEALKVAVSKPPEGGEANRAVLKVLAAALCVPLASVSIVRGHSGARKEARVVGLTISELTSRLESLIDVQ